MVNLARHLVDDAQRARLARPEVEQAVAHAQVEQAAACRFELCLDGASDVVWRLPHVRHDPITPLIEHGHAPVLYYPREVLCQPSSSPSASALQDRREPDRAVALMAVAVV